MTRKSLKLSELAKLTQSKLIGDPDYPIFNVSDLESATAEDASFLGNPRYEQAMKRSEAGVVFITPTIPLIDGRNFLISDNPSLAFQKLVDVIYDPDSEKSGFENIHPSAVIHPSAKIGKNVSIAPNAVIDKNVTIGDHTTIGAGVFIGPYTTIGTDCFLYARVVVREGCEIGNRVTIQPGAVIGSCGFGYVQDKDGKHIKLKQVGGVVIEDDVEIGANATIDRSRFKVTKIGRGTKIDNLVQIGHGTIIGPYNIIIAQTAIAGSTETGRSVYIGGQAAVGGHLKLADGVMIAACSAVSKSLTKAGKYNGIPAVPIENYNRNSVFLRNIEKYVQQIKELEKRVGELES